MDEHLVNFTFTMAHYLWRMVKTIEKIRLTRFTYTSYDIGQVYGLTVGICNCDVQNVIQIRFMRFVVFFILVLKNLFWKKNKMMFEFFFGFLSAAFSAETGSDSWTRIHTWATTIYYWFKLLLPWLVIVRKHPFSVRLAALLLATEVRVGSTSRIAFNAPIRGSDTFFKFGKLFFSAYRWLTSRRFRKKPPSGNSTIHCRLRGMNESRMWSRNRSMVASRCFLPCKSNNWKDNFVSVFFRCCCCFLFRYFGTNRSHEKVLMQYADYAEIRKFENPIHNPHNIW